MKTKFISMTQGELTAEELMVYCARVSNPSNQDNHETGEKLLRYCFENKHWSVFEMVDLTMEIKTSLAIATQILRHKSFSFQQFSQRYANATECEPFSLRKQAKHNRQSSSEVLSNKELYSKASDHLIESFKLYQELLRNDVARESARFILPQATQTTLYMKGSVRSWIHYLQVRLTERTQLEHRGIAKEVLQIIGEHLPIIHKLIAGEEC